MSAATHPTDTLDPREVRAATESLPVAPHAPGMVEVYSEAGRKHIVDLRSGMCSCEDRQYRPDVLCKHARRAEMVLGLRDVPDVERVDWLLIRQREGRQ